MLYSFKSLNLIVLIKLCWNYQINFTNHGTIMVLYKVVYQVELSQKYTGLYVKKYNTISNIILRRMNQTVFTVIPPEIDGQIIMI